MQAFWLALLIWSADRFVQGSALLSQFPAMPSLLIGMLVMGFGTSAPEMLVSALPPSMRIPAPLLQRLWKHHQFRSHPGPTAVARPAVVVYSQVLHKALSILTAATVLAIYQVWDGEFSRTDKHGSLSFPLICSGRFLLGLQMHPVAMIREILI